MAAAPIDRLSALPDDILSQILFLLPTKGSVSTSTLATRWRHLWAHAPNLEFEDTFSENFKTLMSQCAAHNSAVTLRLFVTSRAHSKKFKSINTAIASNPKALDLSFGYDGRVIPLSVFTSKTLVDLRLVRCRTEIRKNEATTRLPALKRLHLERVTLDESLEKVLSGCPVLEELTIKQNLPLCKIRRQDGTPICLPALKRLHLECVELGDSFMNLIYGCPGLEELTVRKNLPNSVNDKSIIMCLPALKRLRLECVELCGGSLESLHIYCPMVSVLAIEGNILSNMFTYETIVDLTVASRKVKIREGDISLPSLKMLHLKDIELAGSLKELLFGCPVLEEFTIRGYFRDFHQNGVCCCISSPIIKRLVLTCRTPYPLCVDTPSLEYVRLLCFRPVNFLAGIPASLIEADIALDCAQVHVAALSNVKYLTFKSNWVRVFHSMTANLNLKFNNLTKLEVVANMYVVAYFLKKADYLEFLILRGVRFGHQVGRYRKEWMELLQVPNCLSTHLRIVEIYGLGYTEHELGMVRYILKNAKVLERMKLHFFERPDKKASRLIEDLRHACELVFD